MVMKSFRASAACPGVQLTDAVEQLQVTSRHVMHRYEIMAKD